MVVCHLGLDVVSINIVDVFLHSTCLLEITDLVKSLVWLAMVTMIFPNCFLNLCPSIVSMLITFPPL